MRQAFLASVALVLVAASGTANAADLPGRYAAAPRYAAASPVAQPEGSWTGFYIGAHGGYGWGHDPVTDGTYSGNFDPRGGVLGAQFGFNLQRDMWVGGVEADFSSTGIKGSISHTYLNGGTEIDTSTEKFSWIGSVRARLGYLLFGNVLFYGTGGLAWTRFVSESSATYVTTGLLAGTTISSSSSPSTMFGWVGGFGIGAPLNSLGFGGWLPTFGTGGTWFGGVEWLHYDFGSRGSEFTSYVGHGTSTSSGSSSGTLTVDVLRGTVSLKL
jgi:outer membrane immunogenic protein